LYDINRNTPQATFYHKASVLDCCSSSASQAFSGSVDRTIKMYDFNTSTETIIGQHEKPVRCVEYDSHSNLLISGSWDSTLKLWDIRSRFACISTKKLPDRVYALSVNGKSTLVVGSGSRNILIYDLRKIRESKGGEGEDLEQQRSSPLKHQTRCIKTFIDNSAYTVGSIEGRVAVEYFEENMQSNKYAFKCHRSGGVAYPVNTMAFHPVHGTFVTGGCDGMVSIWDGKNKKKLCLFHQYPTSIASVDFTPDGTMLAIASSYTFEEGEKDHPPDSVFIRGITDAEVKPKK